LTDSSNQQRAISIEKHLCQQIIADKTEAISFLDNACSKIAERYNLYSSDQPRKAMIIEILARNNCVGCVDKKLREKTHQRIDKMYTELHQFACNILIEELYSKLLENNYRAIITSEENIKYGKVDVFIVPLNYGLRLYSKKMEIAVEVKTGFGLSLPQLFRYMIDGDQRSLILWRIRNSQVLLFEMTQIKPLLTKFVKMILSRANRVLSTNETECKHTTTCRSWSPTQHHLQEAFSDFSKGIIKTLPEVVEIILTKLNERGNENGMP
jgi:hypothetical protein